MKLKYMTLKIRRKYMLRKTIIGMLVVTLAFAITSCLFSGTYVRNGNNATFKGDLSGTSTVSGNSMTGTFDGSPFTATRANTTSNSLAGTWTGIMDGTSVEFIIGNTVWAVSETGSSPEEGGFLERYGNTTSLIGIMEEGRATVSGNTLTGTFGGSSFTATRTNIASNPFVGTWISVMDGVPVEFIIGATTWFVGVSE